MTLESVESLHFWYGALRKSLARNLQGLSRLPQHPCLPCASSAGSQHCLVSIAPALSANAQVTSPGGNVTSSPHAGSSSCQKTPGGPASKCPCHCEKMKGDLFLLPFLLRFFPFIRGLGGESGSCGVRMELGRNRQLRKGKPVPGTGESLAGENTSYSLGDMRGWGWE